MARDLIESLFYYEMDQASSSQSQNGPASVSPEEQGGDMFNYLKKNIFSMFSSFPVPFTRQKSSGHGNKRPESISEESLSQGLQDFTFADNIEMAHFGHVELLLKGHDFILQQLTNPTWCDECGDFIWGLYKQCLRCKYTSPGGATTNKSRSWGCTHPPLTNFFRTAACREKLKESE